MSADSPAFTVYSDSNHSEPLELQLADPDSSSDEEPEPEPVEAGRAPYVRQNAHTVPNSTTTSRKASAMTRPNSTNPTSKKKKQAPLKYMHSSLLAALEKVKYEEAMGDITFTTGLQGREAEKLFREIRPVHNSKIVSNNAIPRHSSYRPEEDTDRQVCPYATCRLMHFESHMEKFRHECPRGAVCTMLSEPEHRRLYTHPADQEDRAVKRLMESSGWASDNFRSKVCAPTYAGAAHQGNTPFPSCVPRGGDRPLGGDTHFGELSGISRRAQVPDYITVVISGIELSWGDIDFYNFVRECTPGYVYEAKLQRSNGFSDGTGTATLGSYGEAQDLVQYLHGRTVGVNSYQVSYEKTLVERAKPLSARKAFTEIDPNHIEAKRFNRHLRACGPYCNDARAILDRMLAEGVRPDVQSWTSLIRSYRDAKPPQPLKANLVLGEMRDHKVPVTAQACNLVVHAFVLAGSMKKAEALVKKMEDFAREREHLLPVPRVEEQPYCAAPTEETYEILSDGWRRAGISEEMAADTVSFGGYRAKKEVKNAEKNKSSKTVVIGSNGALKNAQSLMATWARRRSGYTPLVGMGMLVPQRGTAVGASALYNPSKFAPLG